MAQIEVSESGSFNKVRRIARVLSFLPGGVIAAWKYLELSPPFRGQASPPIGVEWLVGSLAYLGIYALPLILLGIIAWRWPRAGGILLILMAAYFLYLTWAPHGADGWGPQICLPFGLAFLISGVLNILISPWGRKLWHKSNSSKGDIAGSEVPEPRSFKGMRWAARVISLLSGALMTVTASTFAVPFYLSPGWLGRLPGVLETIIWIAWYVSPPLAIGIIAWRWPKAGAVLLILMAASFFLFFAQAPEGPEHYPNIFGITGPTMYLAFAAAFLIGGVLNIIVSPWGRKLWHKK